MVDNQNHRDVSIHDIMVVAFDENGDEVCRNYIGDLLKGERPDKTATLVCDVFPAIITATAEESPCNGANIMILYWIGDADQVELSGETGVILWKSTYQECDEPIPPRRVIENLGEIPKNE